MSYNFQIPYLYAAFTEKIGINIKNCQASKVKDFKALIKAGCWRLVKGRGCVFTSPCQGKFLKPDFTVPFQDTYFKHDFTVLY